MGEFKGNECKISLDKKQILVSKALKNEGIQWEKVSKFPDEIIAEGFYRCKYKRRYSFR